MEKEYCFCCGQPMPKPERVDVTEECYVKLTKIDGALVYLYHSGTPIGLFDKGGFHYMNGMEEYVVENGFVVSRGIRGITWFRVYQIK